MWLKINDTLLNTTHIASVTPVTVGYNGRYKVILITGHSFLLEDEVADALKLYFAALPPSEMADLGEMFKRSVTGAQKQTHEDPVAKLLNGRIFSREACPLKEVHTEIPEGQLCPACKYPRAA